MKKSEFSVLTIIRVALFVISIMLLIMMINIPIKNNNVDSFVIISFIINALFSIIEIKKDQTPYSLNKTFWYYNLIFNFIAPVVQYLTDYHEWGYVLNNNHYVSANLLIFFSMIIYKIFYKRIKKENINIKVIKSYNIKPLTKIVLVLFCFMCLLIVIRNIGFSSLFSMNENKYLLSDNSMFNTIFSQVLKCVPVYIFSILYNEKHKLSFTSIIILIIIIFLNFPTSTTRFWMGSIFIGIFLLLFIKNNLNNRLYDILLLITFTFVFSVFYIFKFNDISYFMENGIEINSFTESFNQVDYDAYSMIPRTFDYVKNNDFSYGRQLSATFFFFVPRSIWNNKPLPSGDLISKAQGQSYNNLSCPYIAEAFLNFGLIGVIIFQSLFAVLCNRLDNYYWGAPNNNKYIIFLYPFLQGFLIYFQRGALHPAVIYFFCFCIPLIIIILLRKIFRKSKY